MTHFKEGSLIIVALYLQPQELYKYIHELIRLAFPEYEICMEYCGKAEVEISVQLAESTDGWELKASVKSDSKITEQRESSSIDLSADQPYQQIGRMARLFIYKLLCRHLDRNINSYGILSGVRPVKIVHRLLDQGWDDPVIIEKLQEDYLMEREKAELLTEIGAHNHAFLHSHLAARRLISIYIGIPFCPSRCYYCSFPGAILSSYESELSPFLQSLHREMEGIGRCIKDLHWEVENIYIGGGTPTVLKQADLADIFAMLQKYFSSSATREITVEAGRPDTLSPAILKFLGDNGVDRICINPQTMHNSSLKTIGRRHEAEDISRAVDWAREAGIKDINMDVIVGLPGEGLEENVYTADKIIALHPDNITVHSLAVKKGSLLAEAEGKSGVNCRVQETKSGIEYFKQLLTHTGYLPYYLYRQKYMKASLENIGYSLPGHFCRYNIQVMEERQTIIGMGGGASSKFVDPGSWSLTSLHNPKDPLSYCRRADELLMRKVDKLRALN